MVFLVYKEHEPEKLLYFSKANVAARVAGLHNMSVAILDEVEVQRPELIDADKSLFDEECYKLMGNEKNSENA